jgi:HTH-type transcriptional regulator / antitoxin HigA
MNIAPIKTQRDYRRALKRIENLISAKRGTAAGDHVDILVTLVEAWERRHCRLDLSEPGRSKYHLDEKHVG